MKSKKVNKNSSLNEFQSMADLVQTASSAGSFAHLVGLGRACHLDNRLVGERSRPFLRRVDLRGPCLASGWSPPAAAGSKATRKTPWPFGSQRPPSAIPAMSSTTSPSASRPGRRAAARPRPLRYEAPGKTAALGAGRARSRLCFGEPYEGLRRSGCCFAWVHHSASTGESRLSGRPHRSVLAIRAVQNCTWRTAQAFALLTSNLVNNE